MISYKKDKILRKKNNICKEKKIQEGTGSEKKYIWNALKKKIF